MNDEEVQIREEPYVFDVDKGPNTCYRVGMAGIGVLWVLLVGLSVAIMIWA